MRRVIHPALYPFVIEAADQTVLYQLERCARLEGVDMVDTTPMLVAFTVRELEELIESLEGTESVRLRVLQESMRRQLAGAREALAAAEEELRRQEETDGG